MGSVYKLHATERGMDVRSNHGRDRKVVGTVCVVPKLDLVFGWFAVVLDMSAFEIAVEGFEVKEGGDVGVRGGTVVALVEIIGKNLPIVSACKSDQHKFSRDGQVMVSHLLGRRCIQARSRRS